ncbi:hypothetical protein DIPPA_02850 [Diplonema papillatum]|nr:hypothetical protein DIPPA_02850 [Diplonema papillatum]
MGSCLCVRAEQDPDAEDAQQLTRRVSRAWDAGDGVFVDLRRTPRAGTRGCCHRRRPRAP